MQSKYKVLIKCILISLIIAIIIAVAVGVACTLYFNRFTLTYVQLPLSRKMRLTFMIFYGLTALFTATSIQLGKIEKKAEERWKEENEKMNKGTQSRVLGVNIAGLIDDTQRKEFVDLYGNKVKAGDDHGTAFMVFKILSIISIFFTVAATLVMGMMMLSLT